MTTARQYGRDDGWGRSTRFYNVAGRDLPSVTSILGAIAKPALVGWAAKQERIMVSQTAADMYEDMPCWKGDESAAGIPRLSRVDYLGTLEKRLGRTKAHSKELTKASEIGTQAHTLIEWTLRGELQQKQGPKPEVSEKALWAFMAWEDWRKTVNLVPLVIENAVWSLAHGYAGTMDLSCELDFPWGGRGVAITDWKTGKGIYGEASLQNAAYVEACIEMGLHERPLAGCIVRLPKLVDDPDFEVKWIHPDEHHGLLKAFLHTLGLWTWLDSVEKK